MSNYNSTSKQFDGNVAVAGTLVAGNISTANEWKSYVPTVTGGGFPTTMTKKYFKYSVQGKRLLIQGNCANTVETGATSTGAYTFSLPTGCKLLTETADMTCGSAFLQTVGSGKKYTGVSYVATTGSSPALGLKLGNETTTPGVWGDASPHATDTDLDFTGGLNWSFTFTVELDPTSTILTTLSK